MNKHFCDIGVRLQSELPDYGNRFLEYSPPRNSHSFYLAPTCKDDVILEIKKMKHMKAPCHLDSIQTEHMMVRTVKIVNYLGLVIDENLYWSAHVNNVCALLVKYFGIFNHIKSFIT